MINVIDLFAGPGGLGEGFAAYAPPAFNGQPAFRLRMSVEKEKHAHRTLTLRAFVRLLGRDEPPREYLEYLRGKLTIEELYAAHPAAAREAQKETLGQPTVLGVDDGLVYDRLEELVKDGGDSWVVIGGPPCQAYSLVGRSRNKGKKDYLPERDNRHFLYHEYLEVLSRVSPAAFVMENVRGILSAKIGNRPIFPNICRDLSHPAASLKNSGRVDGPRYRIYSFTEESLSTDLVGDVQSESANFLVRAENYGIAQCRHRVILLGVREDIDESPNILRKGEFVTVEQALAGLPRLRSGLSRTEDNPFVWAQTVRDAASEISAGLDGRLADLVSEYSPAVDCTDVRSRSVLNSNWIPLQFTDANKPPNEFIEWIGEAPGGMILNHESRGHMRGDLARYLWAACFAKINHRSPSAKEFPDFLAPAHRNWDSGKFADRFRVQVATLPATTITSHISKDGHYYIHPDPSQCRSLTVREAARLQSFPDDYFFTGPRTAQYVQVGNAVPPFLARELAGIVGSLVR